MKIMVVDDDDDILVSTRLALELEDHLVITHHDAGDLLERIQADHPDVVLHDITMDKLDLPEQIRAARAELSDPPRIILFTGHRPDKAEIEAIGADGILEKPFSMDDLLRAIAEPAAAPT